jgi:hypothetical protein
VVISPQYALSEPCSKKGTPGLLKRPLTRWPSSRRGGAPEGLDRGSAFGGKAAPTTET